MRSLALAAALGISGMPACGEEAGGASPATGAVGGVKEGGVASDFAARDIDGKTVRLSDHLGREVVLLDFWATFCQPCLAEMPHLRRLYEENKARGFVVIAVAMDGPDTVADVPSFAKRNGMNFPVVLDEDSRIVSIYNPKNAAPMSVLIDRSGRVFRLREGYNPGDAQLVEEDVKRLLP